MVGRSSGILLLCAQILRTLVQTRKTLYERRFGELFDGPMPFFGSKIECHPISAKDEARPHQFGKEVLSGIFKGHALCAAWNLKGDILVAGVTGINNKLELQKYTSKDSTQKVSSC